MALLLFMNAYGIQSSTATYRVPGNGATIEIGSTTPVSPSGTAFANRNNSAGNVAYIAVPNHVTGFLGVQLLCNQSIESASGLWAQYGVADANGVIHLTLAYSLTGKLRVYRGDLSTGTLLCTSAHSINLQQWTTIGLGYTIDDTAGSITLVFYDSATPTVETFTGLDTRNGGLASVGAVCLPGQRISSSGSASWIDGLYVCDNTGSAPYNTFLGDFRITSQVPAGAGATTQWTPSTGANWATLDENPHNGDTDYVEDSTSGHRDLYTLSTFVSTATTIFAVKHILTGRYVTTAASINPVLRHAGTVSVGSTIVLDNTYNEKVRDLMLLNPVTSAAWTISDMNNLQVGQDVV